MGAEALKGHLDGLLLAVLEPGPSHGCAIIEALRAGSGGAFDLPTGTVYPALHRLEGLGLVSSTWAVESGRRRRVYTLTTVGRKALSARRAGWQEFAQAVQSVMNGGQAWTPAS
jgi:PadR family transcriptional regulator, regulatory protein PadR